MGKFIARFVCILFAAVFLFIFAGCIQSTIIQANSYCYSGKKLVHSQIELDDIKRLVDEYEERGWLDLGNDSVGSIEEFEDGEITFSYYFFSDKENIDGLDYGKQVAGKIAPMAVPMIMSFGLGIILLYVGIFKFDFDED